MSELSPLGNAGIIPYINWVGNIQTCTAILVAPLLIVALAYLVTAWRKEAWPVIHGVTGLYLKIFFLNFIVYTTAFALTDLVLTRFVWPKATSFSFIEALFSGYAFGAVVSLIVGTSNISKIQSKGYPLTEETLKVSHVREITVDLPYNEAFDVCASSLGTIKYGKIQSQDREAGKIIAQAPWYRKFGNKKILFEIWKETDTTSRIRVDIRPTAPMTLYDFGSKLDDIETITKYIKNHDKPVIDTNEAVP